MTVFETIKKWIKKQRYRLGRWLLFGDSRFVDFSNSVKTGSLDKWESNTMANWKTARGAIIDKHGETVPEKEIIGEIDPCPVCKKGVLKYIISNENGHIWGMCFPKDGSDGSDGNCVKWIE
jgi:hypothetical protein